MYIAIRSKPKLSTAGGHDAFNGLFGISYFSGRFILPAKFSDSATPTDEWTIFVWFDQDIENMNFIVPNGAIVKQKDR